MAGSKDLHCIGVMTSGGDAPGMNPAVRAVVRTALHHGIEVYAIHQGYQGMVTGGDMIKKMTWDDVSGILHKGGTIIGTARSTEFRERQGRLKAAKNLITHGIDNLVVIGGDGSLTGADIFKSEWDELLEELVSSGAISRQYKSKFPYLKVVGLVGSIDNDMIGTDWTIGTNTALKRITDAIDTIESTAASHQRTFIVEVMGRNCGYLALMGALSTGADYVLIPEWPPESSHWEDEMVKTLLESRKAGKKESLVIVAEGAKDRSGKEITCDYVRDVLKSKMEEDARITILGHIQRGGAPTAFDRYMSTMVGYEAVRYLMKSSGKEESVVIGMHRNKVRAVSLVESVKKTRSVAEYERSGAYQKAVKLRGNTFKESLNTFHAIQAAVPREVAKGKKKLNLLVMNASGPAPGMNMAVRAAVRIGMDKGHRVLGVKNGFEGLMSGEIREMEWMEVESWTSLGGSVLGTNRKSPANSDFYLIAKNLEKFEIDGIIMIGGTTGYRTIYEMMFKKKDYHRFDIPTVCIPASIANNLPGTNHSIGSDTALNNIIDAVDKIKESAIAQNRAFVVEVMGRECGYLSLMTGLSTGAERVYIPEDGIKLSDLKKDVDMLVEGFQRGKRLGLVIRSEDANKIYSTHFISSLYEVEGNDLFDVRQAILGHLQQGGSPTPFDRFSATTLAAKSVELLIKMIQKNEKDCMMAGIMGGHVTFTDMLDLPKIYDMEHNRPKKQWWLKIKDITGIFEKNAP